VVSPSEVLKKDRTTTILTNEVIIINIDGAMEITVKIRRIWISVETSE
jgi:hypothetical protein